MRAVGESRSCLVDRPSIESEHLVPANEPRKCGSISFVYARLTLEPRVEELLQIKNLGTMRLRNLSRRLDNERHRACECFGFFVVRKGQRQDY